jgi:hypothetical protein
LVSWLPNSRVWIGWRQSSDSGVFANDCVLVLAQHGGDLGLAAGHEHDERACLCRAKRMASSVAVSQACSAVTMSMRSGSAASVMDSSTRQVEEGHAREAEPPREFARAFDQFRRASRCRRCGRGPALKNRS